MKTIDRKIRETLRQNEMLQPGDRVLCAVSGGADSMCLLCWLATHAAELQITVCAAHYEHGLRGEESLRDAAFTETQCRDRNLPIVLQHGNVKEWAAAHDCGEEEAARELRYRFLEEAAKKLNCNKIATAHNAEDNAETVLFHLVRGSGLAGLCGIPAVRGNIIRPLLGVSRSEIEAWLTEQGIPHIEDSSNASDFYSRNYLRHHVLPALKQLNPAFPEAVARETKLLRRDEDCLNRLAQDFLSKYREGNSLPAAELLKLHPSIASRAVRLLTGKNPEARHMEAILELCRGTERATLTFPAFCVRREQGRISFLMEMEGAVHIPARDLFIDRELEIPELGVKIRASIAEIPDLQEEINGLFKTYYFKSNSICGNITVTGHLPGDRMRPAGRNCTKTLRQLFREEKLTEARRNSTLILRDEKGILAAVGLAQDERGLAKAGDSVLRVDILPVKYNSEETYCD